MRNYVMGQEKLERRAQISRETAETEVTLSLVIDGSGKASVATGVPFLDHLLTLFARHGLFDLEVQATGDVEVDDHHTVEDVGIVLGQALKQALGEKHGIRRYGFFILPMDESLVRVVLDLSHRPIFVYQVEAASLMVKDFNILLVREFFQALASNSGLTLHMRLDYGTDPHHIAEALFKCCARALDVATQMDERILGVVPSTKGVLG